MAESATYVRIVGEPFLSRAREYREQRHAWHRAWSAFAQSKGATGFCGRGRNLCFSKGPPPKGWTKPKGKDAMSSPKRGCPDVSNLERMRAEHPQPDPWSVFGDAVPRTLEWVSDGGRVLKANIGSIGIILDGPSVGWAGETFVAYIPDPEAAVRELAAEKPERKVVGAAATWTMPDGLVRITEAEHDLIYAEYRVAEERAKGAPSPRPLPLIGETM